MSGGDIRFHGESDDIGLYRSMQCRVLRLIDRTDGGDLYRPVYGRVLLYGGFDECDAKCLRYRQVLSDGVIRYDELCSGILWFQYNKQRKYL